MTPLSSDLEALVRRLVDVHGEGGLSPTAEDWRAILRLDPDEPIFILNLLKFRGSADAGGGAASGASAYARYMAGVATAFLRVGGRPVLHGSVGHSFPASHGDEWDAAVVSRYPTPRALAEMWLDEAFIEAHAHREDGVEDSRVLVLSDAASGAPGT